MISCTYNFFTGENICVTNNGEKHHYGAQRSSSPALVGIFSFPQLCCTKEISIVKISITTYPVIEHFKIHRQIICIAMVGLYPWLIFPLCVSRIPSITDLYSVMDMKVILVIRYWKSFGFTTSSLCSYIQVTQCTTIPTIMVQTWGSIICMVIQEWTGWVSM